MAPDGNCLYQALLLVCINIYKTNLNIYYYKCIKTKFIICLNIVYIVIYVSLITWVTLEWLFIYITNDLYVYVWLMYDWFMYVYLTNRYMYYICNLSYININHVTCKSYVVFIYFMSIYVYYINKQYLICIF